MTKKIFVFEGKWLNQFHKEATARKMKSIEEMKKSPANYEEEYARHMKMQAEEREREKMAYITNIK